VKFKQGKVFVLAFAGAVLANSSAAHAQGYPSRPITLVVPFGVGSGADLMARVLAVVIENVPGAGGMTGVSRVASGPADGYQIAFGGVDTLAINQTLYKKPLYNAATDFAPVGLVTEQPMVLIARKDFPADDMKGFIAHTKANAAKMQYASSGVGSGSHLTCARLNAAMGVDVTHVTYRGSAQAMQDLFAGRIDYYCSRASRPKESQS
jgi:tripartite-type tricarboxylate transporter receptor subunit TctC